MLQAQVHQSPRHFVLAMRQVMLAVMILAAVAGCAANLATGERHLNLISESQEIQMGKESDAQIITSLGLYSDSSLQRYVQQLGADMAANSERPGLPWTFRVIDDPAVNAFALPGGYIYVTRGLMTHVMNEAQLSAVLGHEIGHVTAQHSVRRISQQQLLQFGLLAGMILKPDLQRYSDYVNTGLGLLFLKFSRDDENQADHLGLRYLVRDGSDPREMIDVFRMLERVSESSDRGRVPEWLATHPSPGNRVSRLTKEIDTLTIDLASLSVNEKSYLDLIDGTVFGVNPREGFFRDNRFFHPELEFEMTFPPGWKTINQKQGVIGVSPNEDAIVQLTLVNEGGATQAAQTFFNQDGLQSDRPESSTLNGLPVVTGQFLAQSGEQVLRGRASFIELRGRTYQLLAYSTEGRWTRYVGPTTGTLQSFRRVTDPEILQIQPMRIDIVQTSQAVSLERLAQQHNSEVPLATLALINQTTTDARFNSGDRVKLVIGEDPTRTSQR